MISNQRFMYASILRKVNGRLYEKLHESVGQLKDRFRADVLEIMVRLEVWMTIWNNECEKKPQAYRMTLHFTTILISQKQCKKVSNGIGNNRLVNAMIL